MPVPTATSDLLAAPSEAEIAQMDAWWRAANYLTIGQIYLRANPLLTEPLKPEHIKPRLLGHWGTSPGLNLVYTHLNRVIKARELDALCVWGPGHGGPSILANSWLEGSYSETYPDVSRDAAGMARLFRQFSFPGGVPSHVAPETPGSIHVTGDDPLQVHRAMAAALDDALDRITLMQRTAREDGVSERVHWPMIVLRTPKGWTGPA